MTFLEWEIYSQWELEDAVETVERLLKAADSILPPEQLRALRVLVSLAEHVADRGSLDEETNKWKVE